MTDFLIYNGKDSAPKKAESLEMRLEQIAEGMTKGVLALREKDWPPIILLYGSSKENLKAVKRGMYSSFFEKGYFRFKIGFGNEGPYTIDIGYFLEDWTRVADTSYALLENNPRHPNSSL